MSREREVTSAPLPREAPLEWARASAAGELEKLEWVELDPDPELEPYRFYRDRDLKMVFRHRRHARLLPPPMVEEITECENNGGASLLQALSLSFARPEWLVQSRGLLWSSLTPVPALLARLVQAYGISGEVHRGDGERLVRLRARLRTWHRRRGEVEEALRLLHDAVREPPAEALVGMPRWIADGGAARVLPVLAPSAATPVMAVEQEMDEFEIEDVEEVDDVEDVDDEDTSNLDDVIDDLLEPSAPAHEEATDELKVPQPPETSVETEETALSRLVDDTGGLPDLSRELMACRDLSWWKARRPADSAHPVLRLEDGFLRFQPPGHLPFRVLREDVVVGWKPGQRLSPLAPRLLPAWACYRIVAEEPEQA